MGLFQAAIFPTAALLLPSNVREHGSDGHLTSSLEMRWKDSAEGSILLSYQQMSCSTPCSFNINVMFLHDTFSLFEKALTCKKNNETKQHNLSIVETIHVSGNWSLNIYAYAIKIYKILLE